MEIDFATLSDASVYVGTWAKYNDGNLFGKWLNLSDYSDYAEFTDACRELHKDEEDPEFDVQDYEHIPEDLVSGLFCSNLYWELLDIINDNPDTDWDMVSAFCDAYGEDIETPEDLEDIISRAKDRCRGQFDSDEDFAHSEYDEEVPKNLPSWIENNIDWQGVAADLMYDYTEENGYYFCDC